MTLKTEKIIKIGGAHKSVLFSIKIFNYTQSVTINADNPHPALSLREFNDDKIYLWVTRILDYRPVVKFRKNIHFLNRLGKQPKSKIRTRLFAREWFFWILLHAKNKRALYRTRLEDTKIKLIFHLERVNDRLPCKNVENQNIIYIVFVYDA